MFTMNREQIELLLKIAKLHLAQFYLAMNDHWSLEDYQENRRYEEQIKKAEQEYREKFEPVPEWEYHEDVVKARDLLQKQLYELDADKKD